MGLELNSIYQGDCLQLFNKLATRSIHLVFADPPFNIGYEYDVYHDRRSRREYTSWCGQWIQQIHRVLRSDGSFWLAIGDEFAAELKLIAQEDVGFHCRSWVIWYYTFGVNCVRGFSRSHTHLFHFVKNDNDFTFNRLNPTVRVLSARQLVYADNRANSAGRLPDNTWIIRPQDAPPAAFAPMHDTWYFARVAGTFKEREGFHGCQMPEQLLGRIIRISSNPCEVVLDPFAGSGTTLAVAKKLGRQWIGFELSQDYVARIKARIESAMVGSPLDGPADPLTSAPNTKEGKSKVRIINGRVIPRCDEQTQVGILEAFQATCEGHSVDLMLCRPQLNAAFIQKCKSLKLVGDPYTWNRVLVRLRKSKKLSQPTETSVPMTARDMDRYSFAGEIAMQLMSVDYQCMLDDVLCHPEYAQEFDYLAARFAPGFSSWEYRWAAMWIRKRAKSFRSIAAKQFQEWLDRPLPAPVALEIARADQYRTPGVYVLSSHTQHLYVGEALDVGHRILLAKTLDAWQDFRPTHVRVLSADTPGSNAMQPVLVQRLKPLLNYRLLYPHRELRRQKDQPEVA